MVNFSLNGKPHMTVDIQKSQPNGNEGIRFNGDMSTTNFLMRISEEFKICPNSLGLTNQCDNKDSCDSGCSDTKNVEDYNQKLKAVLHKYSIKNKSVALLDKGRQIGEKGLILIKDGQLKGFGYVELNHQINNIHILESIITPMSGDENTTFIIESYLRKKQGIKVIDLSPSL